MQCKKCGTIIKDGEKFCGNCGEMVTQVDSDLDINKQFTNNKNIQTGQSAIVGVNKEPLTEQTTSDRVSDNKQKNNNKRNFGIIVMLIIIILLLVGGVFYFLNKNESEPKNNPNNDSHLDNSTNDNNDSNNTNDSNNKNNLNSNISSDDLELLKTAKLSKYFQEKKDEFDKSSSNYSHETYYEGDIGHNLNPIMFRIENGNLVLYQLEKAQPMTRQNYNCEEVECTKRVINLNNEKAKYISVNRNNFDYSINIMVLTERQNIYEGIIVGENCNSLECEYNIQLKKVDTDNKFKEIIQIRSINYGLTTNNILIRTYDLAVSDNIPLFIYTYAALSANGYNLNDGKILDNPLEVAIYENGTLGIGNYDKNFGNTKKFYDILKNDGTKIVAKQIFTTNNCDTFILSIDNYLYKTNLNSCKAKITTGIQVSKYTDKEVNFIEYGYGGNIDNSDNNVVQMSMKKMWVAAEPLNINVHYKDETNDLFQIDRNYSGTTKLNFAGQYYIILEN